MLFTRLLPLLSLLPLSSLCPCQDRLRLCPRRAPLPSPQPSPLCHQRYSTWNGKPALSTYLHKQIDLTSLCGLSDTDRVPMHTFDQENLLKFGVCPPGTLNASSESVMPNGRLLVMQLSVVGTMLALCVSSWAQRHQNSEQAQANQATSLAVPHFEQYKVTKVYRGKPAVPVLRTPEDREYRTRIREGAKAGPNFAGHYTLIIIGCGTQCASFVVVDAVSGRVFSHAQKEYTCGPDFKVDSQLLTTDVCTGAIQKNCNRAFWRWTGTELKFLTRIPIDCGF
jgi:hypothetical protein